MTDQEIQEKIQQAQARKPKTPKPKLIPVNQVINKLKEFGYRTKITHYRYFGNKLLKNADIKTIVKAGKIMGHDAKLFSSIISNFGGATEVTISVITHSSHVVSNRTECSLKDPFKYKVGALISLKRVLEQLPERELKDLALEIKV